MLLILYTGFVCFTGCFKFCFLKKQSLRYPALLFMHGCVPLPFPGLSESWFVPICERSTATNNITFLKALRNLAAGYQDSHFSEGGRQRMPLLSHHKDTVSCTGKTVMGTCTWRHSDEEKYTKPALVSVLTELLWAACCRSHKNTRKMVKRALWVLSPAGGWRAYVPRPPRWFGKFYCWYLQA